MIKGKGGMVWQIRNWLGGDPAQQVAQCQRLGLDWISLKIVNADRERWESNTLFPDNQNADLLPATIEALVAASVQVIAWGYTYGRQPEREATATVTILNKLAARHGMSKVFQIDAEGEYDDAAMRDAAIRYSNLLDSADTEHMLCAYRFPLTYQPQFPVREFMHICEAASPQVYFIPDTRPDGGALQLERSYLQYKGIKDVPFIGIAPTYRAPGGWRASKNQLVRFYKKAIELGHPAVGVWDLAQATSVQLDAFLEINWPHEDNIPPPPDPKLTHRVTALEKWRANVKEVS